jgi:hypothetical protein
MNSGKIFMWHCSYDVSPKLVDTAFANMLADMLSINGMLAELGCGVCTAKLNQKTALISDPTTSRGF